MYVLPSAIFVLVFFSPFSIAITSLGEERTNLMFDRFVLVWNCRFPLPLDFWEGLRFDNIYFDQMVDRIYPTELQLNRANFSDTEASFLDLNLCISIGTVSTKINDKGTILILI